MNSPQPTVFRMLPQARIRGEQEIRGSQFVRELESESIDQRIESAAAVKISLS